MSYSQFGEEEFILEFFRDHATGWFVDIGANNGILGSNTRALFLKGWNGLLVEASPETAKNLAKTYQGEQRATTLHRAVWDKNGEVEFAVPEGENSGVAKMKAFTPEPEWKVVKVPCVTLDTLLEETGNRDRKIDFLTIDTEGCDYGILKAYSFIPRPTMIIVEHDKLSLSEFDLLLINRGYKRIWNNLANAAYA